ncbi:MAG: hypothetical protein MZU91_13075 [Desulfosudis oleivorans]|nr:hypothetical protein [Desulfosudis oleivorans]
MSRWRGADAATTWGGRDGPGGGCQARCLGPGGIILDKGQVKASAAWSALRSSTGTAGSTPRSTECPASIQGTKLIVAAGPGPDASFGRRKASKLTRGSWIEIDRLTNRASLPYVFAGGSMADRPRPSRPLVGPQSGRVRDRFLNGEDLREGRGEPLPEKAPAARQGREGAYGQGSDTSHACHGEDQGHFSEVEGTLSEEAAVAESLGA